MSEGAQPCRHPDFRPLTSRTDARAARSIAHCDSSPRTRIQQSKPWVQLLLCLLPSLPISYPYPHSPSYKYLVSGPVCGECWSVLSISTHTPDFLEPFLPKDSGHPPVLCSSGACGTRGKGRGQGEALLPPNTLAATQKECGKHLENAFLGGHAVAHPTLRCGLAP